MALRDNQPTPTRGEGFTPGPWEWASGLVPPDGPERYADIYKDGGELIIASFNDQIPEGRANARLIAAAPDLLSALQNALIDLEYSLFYAQPGSMRYGDLETSIEVASAAISKALGVPPPGCGNSAVALLKNEPSPSLDSAASEVGEDR